MVEVFAAHNAPSTLQMFVTGRPARSVEALEETTVRGHVMHMLRMVLPQRDIPEPTFFNR